MKNREGCEIEARNINYTVQIQPTSPPFKIWSTKDDEPTPKRFAADDVDEERAHPCTRARRVLKGVNCRARPRELLAVVGPSGAGKSTLLEILAGRLAPSLGSEILVDCRPVDRPAFCRSSGFVAQRDTLFPLLTVRETLAFSAELRLRLPPSELRTRVDALLRELGLSGVACARVGDGRRVRGISGGERQRVSIGVEAIHDPRVLVLDEPTSGLDSASALQIVNLLKSMAEARGRTVVLSIHQPGFRIVKLFNAVLLLADGGVVHHGTVDELHSRISSAGLVLPPHVNPVEFAMDSIEILRLQQPVKDRCTLQQLFEGVEPDPPTHTYPHCNYANSRARETVILARRFAKNVYRTRELFACRTVQMLVAGLILGSIFRNLAYDPSGAGERVGLFAFILTFLLSCTTEALPIFLQEREILAHETSCGSYRVSSYSIANALVFLPFLLVVAILFAGPLYWLVGLRRTPASFAYFVLLIWLILYTANSVVVCFSALVPNFIVGNSVISGVMGAFFLFSGYFISKDGIPSYWVFMHYASLFKYPFEAFLVNEFSDIGRCMERALGVCVMNGVDLLKEEGLGEKDRWRNVVFMVCFIVFYRFCSYVILRCRCSQRGLRSLLV
ncbi:ABC transporter G family member 5 [Acorus calamus]|uniref:ABC transporter G family member 5 n=1 Tax=Acorus calamus TaxID=4465 RepID=A0AAV9EDI3_ACOCL|nr:ABC transporter G family member 5 [Acorus calamus]